MSFEDAVKHILKAGPAPKLIEEVWKAAKKKR
jgi:hypothetical protein